MARPIAPQPPVCLRDQAAWSVWIGTETPRAQRARRDTLHGHGAVLFHFNPRLPVGEPIQQRGAPIDELAREPFVQGVREPILDRACPCLPVRGFSEPFGPVREVGPGPDARDPIEQRLDVSLRAVQQLDLRRDAIFGSRFSVPER